MQREVVLIFGQTGSGKSYLARSMAREYGRVLVADAGFGDYSPIEEVQSYDSLLERLKSYGAFDGRPFRLSYDFRPIEFELPFSTVLNLRDTMLVLEEGDRFDPEMDDFGEVIFRGRHYGISILCVSLHPRSISTELRRQATKIISFRQIFPDDIQWLAEVVGDEAYRLAELPGPPEKPPHPYLLWTQSDGAKIIGSNEHMKSKDSAISSGARNVSKEPDFLKPVSKPTSKLTISDKTLDKSKLVS